MYVFTDDPYKYLFDNQVTFRISAANSYSFGVTSTPTTGSARIRSIPSKLTPAPTEGIDETTDS